MNRKEIFENQLDEKYITLLEKSNVRLHEKSKIFNVRNVLIYSGLLLLFLISGYYLKNIFQTTDVFKGHLQEVAYNPNKLLLKNEQGIYYEINDHTNLKWVSPQGILIQINASSLYFSTTNTKQENWDTYYSLIVPSQKKYTIHLIDDTQILVNKNSTIKFSNNRTTPKTNVFLTGEAYFNVAHQDFHPFVIHTQETKIKVLGTEFNVNSYSNNKKTQVSLVEGSVEISNAFQTKKMRAGQQATVYKNLKEIELTENEFKNFLSWTSDQFYFNNQYLENLTDQIEQWYHIKFIYKDELLRKLRFTGKIKKEDGLLHFLKLIEYSEGIQYRIKEKEIILSKNKFQ